ncbi:MAG: hypothetical protein AAF590_04275 [Pseudomonadota bacterium]
MIERLTMILAEKGDMGHVALFLWAAAASVQSLMLLRDLTATAARLEDFVMAIAQVNAMITERRSLTDLHEHPGTDSAFHQTGDADGQTDDE